MSRTQGQQQCGSNVVIRARRQATMWSGCLVLGEHQHRKISLVMVLSEIVPYHWFSQGWVMQTVSKGCHGIKRWKRKLSPHQCSLNVRLMMIIYLLGLALSDTYVTQSWHLSVWMGGRKSPWPVWVAHWQQCRAHSQLLLSQADSHSLSLGLVWEPLLNSTLCLWH